MSAYDQLIAEGKAEGILEGEARGEVRGRTEEKAEMIVALLGIGKLNTAEIAAVANVSEAYVLQLKDQHKPSL